MDDIVHIKDSVSPEFLSSEVHIKTLGDTSSDEENIPEDEGGSELKDSLNVCQPVLRLIDEENLLILPPEDQEEKSETDTALHDGCGEVEKSSNGAMTNKPETPLKSPPEGQVCKKKRKKKHLVVNLSNCKYESVRRVLKRFGFRETEDDEDWCLYWTDYSVTIDKVLVMKQWQKINHFPGMSEICRKDSLARNLNRMIRLFPKDYNIFPKTWCLPSDWNDVQNYARKHKSKTFIIKPDNGCQGRGIYITKNAKDIRPVENMICQVYISRPFLIDGYKFDLRIYVLLTSCDPLRLFVFKDGLVRFTTYSYIEPNQRNVHDMYMHLTNYAVQKHSEGYIRDNEEGGTKRRITTLNRWFKDNGYDVKKIWEDIDDVIIKTLLSGYAIIRHNYRTCFPNHIQTSACFEILGFDILFNHRLKPYVLEVNHSPSFTTDSKLDKEIKEAMLWDTVQLAHFNAVSKKKCCDEERKRIRNRLLHKNIDKDHKCSLERDVEKYQALSEKYENSHMGNFRLIYPSNDLEKYSSFLNPTATFYQETVTYKVRSECARQLREEIRLKQEKLDLIANKHKQSQSESPAPKRLRIKINTGLLSQQLMKSDNNDEIVNNSNQLIPINKVDFNVNNRQNNQEEQRKPDKCLEVPTERKQEKDSDDNHPGNQASIESTLNNGKVCINTKLPQPILDDEETERRNELKKREDQMHKIGLISILYELFAQNKHSHSLKIKDKKGFNELYLDNNTNTEQNCIEHRQSQQETDKKKGRELNVLKPTTSWKNRTQLSGRQKYWIKNQGHGNSAKEKPDIILDTKRTPVVWDNLIEKNKPSLVPQMNQCFNNYFVRLNGNRCVNSAQPSINNPTFGAFPSHQLHKIHQQKSQQSHRVHSGNFYNGGIHSNPTIINPTNGQNLPANLDSQAFYQDCNDTTLTVVKSHQSVKNSFESICNPIHTSLRMNENCGFLPSRSIRSNSAIKSKYIYTDLTSCNNNSNNITTSNSQNASRQNSHNSSSKKVPNDSESVKTAEKYKTPLPTLVNPRVNTSHNSHSPQLMINGLMPVVTSAKLNRVARRSSNQEYYRTVLNE
ncbi:tubulin tyrosine ligase-related [Schistosoma mansoni]|uniref:tubulin tyrosine ligase-related n=1 Tax=Schistosoma mansoni TaxID=6183 RepID=UPI0001A62873|nr:tubulin tyrosine ligase-related [Schistosoma mansoni]|eukprot:XP_018650907.1 tubulin tyrosine ligase-related [Schistosoma mansoni]